jgi:peptidoglycan/xylan/chitin deacetylase (PgdA/CDA1 family)
VARGLAHEVAAHGMRWADSYNMSYEQEKAFIGDGVEVVERFIRYAKSHPKVSFMRKDQIAQIVLTEKNPLIDNTEAAYNH